MSTATSAEVKVIGTNKSNFWLWSEKDGFDLTHPATPDSPQVQPRISLQTTNSPIEIAPTKTALVIVDMQNFFVSRSLGRKGECHEAETALLRHAIPAARKAGIQIIWVNWGLTEAELENMSPGMMRLCGFNEEGVNMEVPRPGETSTQKEVYTNKSMGDPLGEITLMDGRKVDMGRLFMRNEWNSALHKPLEDAFQASLSTKLPDVKVNKNRISGVCDSSSELADYLNGPGSHIRTLLFTGVNTDQCVLSTMVDSNLKGWDTVLLKDGCGTTSPDFASHMSLYNCAKIWGFVSSCEQLSHGVENMKGR